MATGLHPSLGQQPGPGQSREVISRTSPSCTELGGLGLSRACRRVKIVTVQAAELLQLVPPWAVVLYCTSTSANRAVLPHLVYSLLLRSHGEGMVLLRVS